MILSSRREHANPRTAVPSHLASSGRGVLRRFASVRLRPVQMGVWVSPRRTRQSRSTGNTCPLYCGA